MKTFPRLFVPALILSLAAGACSSSSDSAQDPANAAKIGATVVTTAQLADEVNIFKFIASINGSECGATPAAPGASPVPAVFNAPECNRQALSYLIQGVYVHSYATANKIAAPAADVTKAVSSLDTQIGASAIDAKLKAAHLTRTDLTALARDFVLAGKVRDAVVAAAVPDSELQGLYTKNIAAFTNVDLDHILVKTKAAAENVYKQVTAPGFTQKDFEALATKVSTDPGVAQNSGHYAQPVGALPGAQSGGFVKPFADAVLALKPGEISKPVQSDFGWHVILLNSKTVVPFSQAKAQLLQSQGGTAFQAWLTAQDKTSPVTVNPKFGTYDPAQGVIPVTSTAASGASQTPAAPASASGS
ncbi:MAG: peptidylprolyl isomerase [Actinomycetota bacterium]